MLKFLCQNVFINALLTILIFSITFLLSITPLFAQTLVSTNFDNTSDLTTFYNGDSLPTSINVASGGISNSGTVTPVSAEPEVWTLKTGLSISTGDTFRSSINFLLQDCYDCFVGLGLSPNNTNNFNSEFTYVYDGLSFGSNDEFGSFHLASSYNGISNSTLNGFLPSLLVGNWYQFRVTAIQKNNDFLDYTMELYDLSPSGVLGNQVKSQSDSVFNPVIANISTFYPYFYTGVTEYGAPSASTDFVSALDNASFSISPPAPPANAVPTLSAWGLIILTLIVLNIGALAIHHGNRNHSLDPDSP